MKFDFLFFQLVMNKLKGCEFAKNDELIKTWADRQEIINSSEFFLPLNKCQRLLLKCTNINF